MLGDTFIVNFDEKEFWAGVELHNKMSVHRASLVGFDTWETATWEEILKVEAATTCLTYEQSRAHEEEIINRKDSVGEVKANLFGAFAVSLFTSVETLCKKFCVDNSLQLKKRAYWGDIEKVIQSKLGKLALIPGHESVERARILSNCFKHNNGLTNEEFKAAYKIEPDTPIDYVEEAWRDLIDGIREFLVDVKDRLYNLPPLPPTATQP